MATPSRCCKRALSLSHTPPLLLTSLITTSRCYKRASPSNDVSAAGAVSDCGQTVGAVRRTRDQVGGQKTVQHRTVRAFTCNREHLIDSWRAKSSCCRGSYQGETTNDQNYK